MSLKVTLGDLRNGELALVKLSQQDLPIVTSYQLSKLTAIALKELEALEKKRYDNVIKYGNKPKKDEDTIVTEKNMPKFLNDMGELYRLEVELPGEKFKLEKLLGAKISASDISFLGWLIKDK